MMEVMLEADMVALLAAIPGNSGFLIAFCSLIPKNARNNSLHHNPYLQGT